MVCRPDCLISAAEVRMTPPAEVIAKTSSSGCTIRAPTSSPRLSTIRAVSTPRPPRPWTGYWSTGVRLAYPPSVATRTSAPSRTTYMPSSWSPSVNRMPITPEVARPMGRSASSSAWNLIDWACLLTSSRSSSGEISSAAMTSSSSRRLMAMMPPERGESKSVSRDFFTSPELVASTRYGATA